MHAGLVYINEIDQSQYCDTTYTQYPCAAGEEYYGRVDPFNSHGKKLLIITSCKQLDSTDQEIRSRIDRIFETRLFPRIRVKA
jgi:hypothetical protein